MEEGEQIKFKNIVEVELGSEFFDIYFNLDGKFFFFIVFKQILGSNGSDVIEEVKVKIVELEKEFFVGIKYQYSYDVFRFLDVFIEQVIYIICDVFFLVVFVVFIFLGDWCFIFIFIFVVLVFFIGVFFFY